jgi:hypothetical protein
MLALIIHVGREDTHKLISRSSIQLESLVKDAALRKASVGITKTKIELTTALTILSSYVALATSDIITRVNRLALKHEQKYRQAPRAIRSG